MIGFEAVKVSNAFINWEVVLEAPPVTIRMKYDLVSPYAISLCKKSTCTISSILRPSKLAAFPILIAMVR